MHIVGNPNFDLCMDDGTADALFGTGGGPRMLSGTASLVPC